MEKNDRRTGGMSWSNVGDHRLGTRSWLRLIARVLLDSEI